MGAWCRLQYIGCASHPQSHHSLMNSYASYPKLISPSRQIMWKIAVLDEQAQTMIKGYCAPHHISNSNLLEFRHLSTSRRTLIDSTINFLIFSSSFLSFSLNVSWITKPSCLLASYKPQNNWRNPTTQNNHNGFKRRAWALRARGLAC